jgi:photosystem II protein
MVISIQFFNNFLETTLPSITLTKSRNGQTGTATFLFKNPSVFKYCLIDSRPIQHMSLIWENNKIQTQDINIHFYKGKPFLLESIFIFTSSKNWFYFLSFMNVYSKETGLSYEYNETKKEKI